MGPLKKHIPPLRFNAWGGQLKLFDFLDIKYRSTAIELQKEYSPFIDGKAKAAHGLIGICRTLSKWLYTPLILAEYLLVLSRIKKAPEPIEAPLKPTPIKPVPSAT